MHGSQFVARDRVIVPAAAVKMSRLTSGRTADERIVAEECPIALVYDGTTIAVLMATPADLPDLAVGFSLTEGIIHDANEIDEINIAAGRTALN